MCVGRGAGGCRYTHQCIPTCPQIRKSVRIYTKLLAMVLDGGNMPDLCFFSLHFFIFSENWHNVKCFLVHDLFPHYSYVRLKRTKSGVFPDGPVVKNLPSNAGDWHSIPGGGPKIPHASGQLSPSAANREACAAQGDPAQPKIIIIIIKIKCGFPGGSVVKNPPANAGGMGSISHPGRSHMPWSN